MADPILSPDLADRIVTVLMSVGAGGVMTRAITTWAGRRKTAAETHSLEASAEKARAEVLQVEATTNEIVERVAERIAGRWEECERRYARLEENYRSLELESKEDRRLLHEKITGLEAGERECERRYEELRDKVTKQSIELETYRRMQIPPSAASGIPAHITGTVTGTVSGIVTPDGEEE